MSRPNPSPRDAFVIERHGDITVYIASPLLEKIDFSLHHEAADVLIAPIKDEVLPNVVVDLSAVDYFGSMFVAILLRFYKTVERRGGEFVLCGVTERAAELLRITSLDQVWAVYPDRREAIEALTAD